VSASAERWYEALGMRFTDRGKRIEEQIAVFALGRRRS
jgi:hypothetical protein